MNQQAVSLPSIERQREITENYRRVKDNIARAMDRRRVGSGEVRLLAATKTVPPEDILFAVRELGLDLIGENRTAELTEKYPYLNGAVEQHFIGHLQTNKVNKVVGSVSVIESVDSLRLAAEIDRRSRALGIVTDILVEVNSGREESKGGVMPEDVFLFCEKLEDFSSIRVRGMMTMAPVQTEKEEFRKFFRETYGIFIDFFTKKSHNIIEPVFSLPPILSMGMSDSYEIAVEEGATEVRVGSAIFGRRVYPTGNDNR
ncbi:MAG: YggS family pyridoxal phosphate-dependent enzyme [Clostridia bacterium]|nr:YggS family pyridoxal phosphate-dependent enzyme [Clostridia bacterium]